MKNPIIAALSQNMQANPLQQMRNNPMATLQQFNEFKKLMHGRNPQVLVNELLKSGKMTTEQFEQLKQQVSMFQNILK